MAIPQFKMNIWVDLESFYRSDLIAAEEKFGSEFNETCVQGIWVSVDLEKSQGCVAFPAMATTYKMDFSWLQQPYVHVTLPVRRKELNLKKFMTSMHPRTNIYTKFEDLFFTSEVLRCNGCEILPRAKKLDGEKLLSDSKKKVQPFLLQSAGPSVTAEF